MNDNDFENNNPQEGGENPGGDNPGGGNPGGDNPGGDSQPGGGSSSDVTWSGATEITSGVSQSNQTYTSTSADENALLINTSEGTYFQNATVEKSGDSDGGDNCNFYGINSAIMVMGGGTASIDGGTVTATAKGANGIFSYGGNGGTNGAAGDGTTVIIMNTQITTTGDNGGGFMTTGGGVTYANNLTVTTSGQSSAAIRTDRGGGTVYVNGGTYTSNGLGSPAVYSTANISITSANLVSNKSEGVCIEGENSVSMTDCTLTVNNTQTNGQATFLDAIMIYQSQSGDAADGTSAFSMNGGTINSQSGHVFHVTNTNAVINLSNVTINNTDSDNILLSVCDDGWSGAENVATLNADSQNLTGDILVGSNSTFTLNISDNSTFTGNISGNITNAAGESVSTAVGTVNVTIDESSKWYLSDDTYISSFSGSAANVITNGFTLYVNNSALDGTTDSGDSALNIDNTINNTLITGTSDSDSIINRADNVTINTGDGNDTIFNGIDDTAANNVLINTGNGNNLVSIQGGSDAVTVLTADGDNSISTTDPNNAIFTGSGNDVVTLFTGSNNGTVDTADGDDTIFAVGQNVTINSGAGNDIIRTFRNAQNITINAGAGDDVITVNGDAGGVINYNLIQYASGDGNDSIYNISENDSIQITSGSISAARSEGSNVILTVGTGSITIVDGANSTLSLVDSNGTLTQTVISGSSASDSTINDTVINGTSGDDSLTNNGSNVTINALSGNDTIISTGDGALINTGDGDNIISVSGADNVTINTGDGTNQIWLDSNGMNDIVNFGNGDNNSVITSNRYSTVYGGSGSDHITLHNGADSSYIEGGEGDDVFAVGHTNITLYGGEGNDVISLYRDAHNDLINAGIGDDSIIMYGGSNSHIFEYTIGDGNDTITNITSNDTLRIIDGSIAHANSDSDGNIILTFVDADGNEVDGSITFTQSDLEVNVAFGDGPANIFKAIHTGDTLVSGTDDDDTLFAVGNNITLEGGEGNDVLHGGGTGMYLDGGTGNDILSILGLNSTVNAGDGHDSINITSTVSSIFIQKSSGNDTINGYNSNSTIEANVTDFSIEGSNVIFTTDEGTLTVIDGNGATFNIANSDGSVTETLISAQATLAASVAQYALQIIGEDAKYPAMALDYFNPTEENPAEPTLAASSETMTITSADNLKLSGVHFTPENSTDNWVILVHGYGKNHKAMNGFVDSYLQNGYNVLAIDQRAAGDSEGEYLTMGVAESNDVALWTKAIADINSDAKITLHGVSMGAATVMLAAANSNATNISAVVEDCGYTDVREVFINLVANTLGVDDTFVDALYAATQTLTGYDLNNAAPINSIANVNAKTLFINGDNDSVVPASMAQALYDAATSDKDILIVEGASHAAAIEVNYADYYSAVFNFATPDGFIAVGESLTIDGVTYTALDSFAQLTVNDGVVTGIDSGKVAATFEEVTVTLDATNGDFAFTAAADTNLQVNGVNYIAGAATLNADSIVLSAGAAVSNSADYSFTVFNSGVYTIDAQIFNLADNVESGLTLTNTDSGFVSSRVISANEVDNEVIFDSDVGKVFTENVTVTGDDSYSINLGTRGISELSNITSGANVSISGVFDGISDYSLVNIVTDSEGEFAFGDTSYTITGDDSVDLTVRFESDGTVAVTNVADLQGTISGNNISAVMTDTGSVVINGKTFVMTETPEAGVTVTAQENTFAVTHAITQSEADEFDDTTDADIGKLYEERATITGDSDYTVNCRSWGYKTVEGLSAGASVNGAVIFDGVENEYGAEYDFITDSEGVFTFGDSTYTITGDDSVELTVQINGDGSADITNVADLQGTISGNNISAIMTDTGTVNINGITFVMTETPEGNVTVSAQDDSFTVIHAITQSEADEFDDTTDADIGKLYEERATIIGDSDYTVNCRSWGYKTVAGLSAGASVNGAVIFDGVENEYGAEYDFITDSEGVFTFGDTSYTITGDDSVELTVQINGDGSADITDINDLDGYIYGRDSVIGAQLIDNSDANVSLVSSKFNDTINNSGDNVTITAGVGDNVINNTNANNVYIDAGDGDNLIDNNLAFAVVDSVLSNDYENETVITGAGNDTIQNSGGFYVSVNSGAGNDLISNYHSYYSTIDAGDGHDSIVIGDGHYQYIHAGAGNDTIIGTVGSGANDWALGGNATILAGEGNDYIAPVYTNDALIDAGDGNDTIITTGENLTVDAGAGYDLISIAGSAYINIGNDNSTIANYSSNITIQAATFNNSSINDNDLTLINDSSTLTIIDGVSKFINLVDDTGASSSILFNGKVSINGNSTVNGTVYSGAGTVAVDNDSVTLSGVSVASVDNAVINGSVTIGNAVYNAENVTIESFNEGVAINGNDVTITGDDSYVMNIAGSEFSLEGLSSGATVKSYMNYSATTTQRGEFSINDKDFSVSGDNSVEFEVVDGFVNVNDLNGTLSGELNSQVINGTTITADSSVIAAEGNSFVVNGVTYEAPSGTSLLINGNTSNIDEQYFLVEGDSRYTVEGSTLSGISNGASVSGGGDYEVITDSQGNFTFNKNFTVSGDNSVTFIVNNDEVQAINELSDTATVSGDFSAGVSINGNLIQVENDTVSVTDNVMSGISAGANVASAVGVVSISTDNAGEFNILGKEFTVSGDNSVSFVENGVNEIENATLKIAGDGTVSINGGSAMSYETTDKATFIVAEGAVSSIDGVNVINNVENATIHATGSIYVNNTAVNVSGDSDYNVVVSDSAVVSLNNINANAAMNLTDMTVAVNEEGAYTFGNERYTIIGDSEVNFEVNDSGAVENISGLNGGVVASRGVHSSINGVDINVSDAAATVYGSRAGISNVEGLSTNATVTSSALDSITLSMSGDGTLNANEVVYVLSNDSDGISITGKQITGLNENATLQVDAASTYTVNGALLNAAVNDLIIGEANSAYIYDPNNIRITNSTTTEEIIEQLGAAEGYAYTETNASVAASLISSGELDGNMSLVIGAASENEIDFSESSGRKLASITSGAHTVKFNDDGDNVAVIDSGVSNAEDIELGDSGDIVVIEDTRSRVSILGGAGNDTVVSKGGNVIFAMDSGGVDRIVANGGTIELENYNATTGAGIQANSNNIIGSIVDGTINFAEDGVQINGAEIIIDSDIVNIYNNNGDIQKVGYSASGSLDASSIKSSMVIVGVGDATLKSGTGDDTIIAGEGAVIDAGSGNNYVLLDSDTERGGATIELTATSGRTTVDNFKGTFEDGDMVNADSDSTISFDGSNVTIKSGRNRVILNEMSTSSSADTDDEFGEANSAKLLIGNSRTSTKTEVAASAGVVLVDENEIAEQYIGENSGIDLTSFSGAANINLGIGKATLDGSQATVSGFNRLRAGEGNSTLYGSSGNESIYAGAGESTIYGNGGRDTLIGYSGDDKEAGSMFRANEGKATIEGFEFLTDENADTADRINTFDQRVENLRVSDGDLIVELTAGRFLIADGAGKDIQFSTENVELIAQINSDTLNFDGTANYYQVTGKNATVIADDALSEAEIWLDNSHDNDFYGDIKYLDASGVEGETSLVGNDKDNVIIAGKSDSSLWGGSGGNDTLIGGDGDDTFWYFYGNGNDVVQGASNNDTVKLANVTFDMFDVSAIEIGDNSIKVNFHDGGSVALDTNEETTFALGDDSKWVYDKDDKGWKSKS